MATSDPTPALRLTALTAVVAVLFVGLVSRLWFLQILAGDRYEKLAESNAVRVVLTEAPRGRILDRDGAELVKNRVAHTISADRSRLLDGAGNPKDETARQVLDRLSELLHLPVDEIVSRLTSPRYSPFRPIPIMIDVAPEVVFAISEHAELFPGVVAERLPVREYPFGDLASHALGYVREIGQKQLDSPEFAGYRPGDIIGYDGLEQSYEQVLQGTEGYRKFEVNASGTVLRELGGSDYVPGDDLVTTLDSDLQQQVEQILADGIVASRNSINRQTGRHLESTGGAAVVLDPHTGEVLAMASYPTYDPREFVGGLSDAYSTYLFPNLDAGDPDTYNPWLNRVIGSRNPPGSTWKIVSGLAALTDGQITPDSTVDCPSAYRVGVRTFRNWNYRSEGRMDLSTALMRSCDTFFYQLAYDRWLTEERKIDAGEQPQEVFAETAHELGFGQPTEIDLPNEASGTVPDRAWKLARWEANKDRWCAMVDEYEPGTYFHQLMKENCDDGYIWRGGDAVNTSIGQGDLQVTPIQLATAYGAVANGGTVWWPHLGKATIDATSGERTDIEPRALNRIDAPDSYWHEIQQGLQNVVMGSRGTAVSPFLGFPLDQYPVAGKTGTAEACCDKLPFSWFASYAPANDPKYVVAVTVEQGGGGGQTSAPIVRRIYEALFGLPVSPFAAGPDQAD